MFGLSSRESLPATDIIRDERGLLDFREIQKRPNGQVTYMGQSGRKLSVRVAENIIAINSLDNPGVYLNLVASYIPAKRYLKIGINTREASTGRPHPEMHAGRMVDAGIAYLGSRHPVLGIDFEWRDDFQKDEFGKEKPSDTLLQYRAVRGNMMQETYDAVDLYRIQRAAAMSTWTARRVAIPHGFSHIDRLEEELNTAGEVVNVSGRFVRSRK